MTNFSEPVQQDPINLHPCAYLHNYKIEKYPDVIDDQYKYYLEQAPVFASGDVRSGATMQIASAVGEGASAALSIREYLTAFNKNTVATTK